MQRGTVGRHGDGWRGRWREDGRLRSTRTVRTKGEASRLLDAELRRLELGERWNAADHARGARGAVSGAVLGRRSEPQVRA